jgi:hypothetical protein
MKKAKSGKKQKLKIDFTGVESGGRTVPDGNYLAKIDSVEEKESGEGNPYLGLKLKIQAGKAKGSVVYDNISLLPQALWKLRTLLERIGFEVPDGEMDFDPQEIVGEEVTIVVVNETYDKKERPRVGDYLSTAENEEEEDEEEDEAEEGEEEEESAEDESGETDEAEEEEADEEEAEEEEEEEKPKKKTAKTSKAPKFTVKQKVSFKDEDGKTVKGKITSLDGNEAVVTERIGKWRPRN